MWHGEVDCDDAPIKVNAELKPYVEIRVNPVEPDGGENAENEVEEEKKSLGGKKKKPPKAVPARAQRVAAPAPAPVEIKASVSFCPLCYSRNLGDMPPASNSRKK